MDKLDVIIVGSGPGGLSAAVRAHDRGLDGIVLERAGHLADTIHRYQRGKLVTAGPLGLPQIPGLPFEEGPREQVLETWMDELNRRSIVVRCGVEVTAVTKSDAGFSVETATGEKFHASNVVMAVGVHGNLNMLDLSGADWDGIQYELADAALIEGERIVVIGAGDSAVENALALADHNQVIVVNRKREIVRATERNRRLMEQRIASGRIEYLGEAVPTAVAPGMLTVETPEGHTDIRCDRIVARLGATPPRKFLEDVGASFANDDPGAPPDIDGRYQTAVAGLFLIGAVTGYPMIKHAINQGREVIDYICGDDVAPADEPLLIENLGSLLLPGGVADTLDRLRHQVPLMRDLSPLQLRQLFHRVQVQDMSPGETVFDWGDYPDGVFMVATGSAIAETDSENDAVRFDYPKGAIFGEVLALSGRPSETRVRVGPEGASLIRVPKHIFLRWLHTVPSIGRVVDRLALIKTLRLHLSTSLTDEALEPVLAGARIMQFKAGEVLFQEGDAPDGLHVIRKGSVTVSKKVDGRDAILAYLPAGHYVGEMSLVSGDNRLATVRAAVKSETIMIESGAFQTLMQENPLLRRDIEHKILSRLEENESTRSSEISVEMAEFFTQYGIGEATDILVIDEQLCIHCNNCETACADTHDGTSRLDLRAGGMIAGLHVPTSCRHCENPLCMIDCPPDAIHRNTSGEVFIDQTCIGCGNCAENCPYDVIQMAAPKNRGRGQFLAWLFGRNAGSVSVLKPGESADAAVGIGSGPSELENYDADSDRKKTGAVVAVKCDMCTDLRGGPACVRSCPTGAAMRLGPEDFFQTSRARGHMS